MRVKICGLRTLEDMRHAVMSGAQYIGLVFFEKSPRNIDIERARKIAIDVPAGVMKVGLFVDPDDDFLSEVLENVPLDMIQLHGSETPKRVLEIREKFGLPIMKAIGVSEAADLERLEEYAAVDQFLLDAKPPKNAALPGGNGVAFNWALLANVRIEKPWMLAGGLHPDNVAEAIALSGANQLDVSSGVESAPGIKDKARIEAFINAARGTI